MVVMIMMMIIIIIIIIIIRLFCPLLISQNSDDCWLLGSHPLVWDSSTEISEQYTASIFTLLTWTIFFLPHRMSACFGKEENIPVPGIEPRFFSCQSRRVVTKPSGLARFIYSLKATLYFKFTFWTASLCLSLCLWSIEASWNVMAHAQKTDFVFRRNGWVHLNRRGRQFSWLLAAEVCASAVVMLDTPRS